MAYEKIKKDARALKDFGFFFFFSFIQENKNGGKRAEIIRYVYAVER